MTKISWSYQIKPNILAILCLSFLLFGNVSGLAQFTIQDMPILNKLGLITLFLCVSFLLLRKIISLASTTETIELDSKYLTISRKSWISKRTRTYPINEIKKVKRVKLFDSSAFIDILGLKEMYANIFIPNRIGLVQFSAKLRRVKFGNTTETEKLNEIVKAIDHDQVLL